MSHHHFSRTACGGLLFLLLSPLAVYAVGNAPALLFEENKTQWDPAVRYHAAVPGGEVWLRATGFTYAWTNADDQALLARYVATEAHRARPQNGVAGPSRPLPVPRLRAHAVQVDFEGASPTSPM